MEKTGLTSVWHDTSDIFGYEYTPEYIESEEIRKEVQEEEKYLFQLNNKKRYKKYSKKNNVL